MVPILLGVLRQRPVHHQRDVAADRIDSGDGEGQGLNHSGLWWRLSCRDYGIGIIRFEVIAPKRICCVDTTKDNCAYNVHFWGN